MSIERANIKAELLEDVKNYLNITWKDETTDRKIRGLIASGMVYIDGKHGIASDYESDGMPRTLLMEYVRYARDSALDVFENNYQSFILSMRNERAVRDYAESTVSTDG